MRGGGAGGRGENHGKGFSTAFGVGFWAAVVCALAAFSNNMSWLHGLMLTAMGVTSSGGGPGPDCRDLGPDGFGDMG